MSTPAPVQDLFWRADRAYSPAPSTSSAVWSNLRHGDDGEHAISLFERIITAYPPVLESLLSQLPTTSLLDLFHTSAYLRAFLASYPLAWKTLSFRLPQPAVILGSPGNETPDGNQRQSKQYSLDSLLIEIVVPFGTRLKNLDLCNTAVTGIALVSHVLQPRRDTLQHLSVRGCKNVSIKYHIVPFLEPYTQKHSPWARRNDLALKSLYTYRCRHHRRRPYLPQSLVRRDSDSEPTHQLIEICHQLGIWTDTAWCPTPGGRCSRRKDYHTGRAPGTPEVWVPFDRLWRSSNRIGPGASMSARDGADCRLWETAESGHDGEPLGPGDGPFPGEGKDVPSHQRWSHRTFVENIKCDQCGDAILERCENCSVRMHCVGCRKTLCASCAFNRPLPRKRAKTRHFTDLAYGSNPSAIPSFPHTSSASQSASSQRPGSSSSKNNRFWWAPGAVRSPNLMAEPTDEDDSSDSDDHNANGVGPANPPLLKLNMHWCCLEPVFSGGGGIAFLGANLSGRGADRIRAAPLPRSKAYEDPDFTSPLKSVEFVRDLKNPGLYEHVLGEDVDILPYLRRESIELQESTCPRSLCQDCYRTFRWRVSCRACKKPICKEHDFRALKVRRCGFRDLTVEREYVRNHPEPQQLVIPAFKSSARSPLPAAAATFSNITNNPLSSLSTLRASSNNTPIHQHHNDTPTSSTPSGSAAPDMTASLSEHYDLAFGPVVPRSRSLSVSNVPSRPSSSWQNPSRTPAAIHLPLPCYPRHPVQWEGCGAYFCQAVRPIGDNRPRCPGDMLECRECHVLVCGVCIQTNKPCTCTYCATNYHCPHCAVKPHIASRCVREEEVKAQLAALVKERERRQQEKEQLMLSDELMVGLGDFLDGVWNEAGAAEGAGDVLVQAEIGGAEDAMAGAVELEGDAVGAGGVMSAATAEG